MVTAANELSPNNTVLVVEDEPSLQRLLRMAFNAANVSITQAYTGSEALQVLESARPQAVVLDIGLPDGRGKDVLEWLRGAKDTVPWLVISAMDRQQVGELFGDLGDRFLAKPFDTWVLVERIESLIHTSSS